MSETAFFGCAFFLLLYKMSQEENEHNEKIYSNFVSSSLRPKLRSL